MMVVESGDLKKIIGIIQEKAKTGFIGDGKIFVSPVETAFTIRTGEDEL
jgi:nitrogen regulatory protein PII 1